MRQQGQGRQARWQKRLAQVKPEQMRLAERAYYCAWARYRPVPTLREWIVRYYRNHRNADMLDYDHYLSRYPNVLPPPPRHPWDDPELYEAVRKNLAEENFADVTIDHTPLPYWHNRTSS